MPEGDSLYRIAERLRPALAGKALARFDAPRLRGDRPRPGTVIESVESKGKNLLIGFAGGLVLRTHLRMNGSWHLCRVGDRWPRAPYTARAVIETDDGWCAVCFQAPVVETFHRQAGEPPALARLGPDLCAADVDLDTVLVRLAAMVEPGEEIGTVLMDQRIAAGVGNIWKSETCFACGVDPFTPVERLPEATRRQLYATAHRLLRANVGPRPRGRPGAPGHAVYRRAGQSCRRCGTPVRARRQGPDARTTYWCPACQPVPVA